jgi:hypothetical protein
MRVLSIAEMLQVSGGAPCPAGPAPDAGAAHKATVKTTNKGTHKSTDAGNSGVTGGGSGNGGALPSNYFTGGCY